MHCFQFLTFPMNYFHRNARFLKDTNRGQCKNSLTISQSSHLKHYLEKVSSTLGLSKDFECCFAQVKKDIGNASKSESTVVALRIKKFLKIIYKYSNVIKKPVSKKVTENVYFRWIWSPILEVLFTLQYNRIRIKGDESINAVSNKNKSEQYSQCRYIKSLNIDFRFSVDITNGEEVDVAVGKRALNNGDNKAIAEEGK